MKVVFRPRQRKIGVPHAPMWGGKRDGAATWDVFRVEAFGWSLWLTGQDTGDAYGRIGGRSWVASLYVTRDPR